ncbi:MAG: GlsB/YeaQ/YmgE family stress response membrane protein [Gemmatimonadota bacterium]
MRNVIAQIIFGLLAGGIAKFIMPGKDPGGCLVTSALGIVGALVGGWIGKLLFGVEVVAGFNLTSLGVAILGSLLLLLVYRLFIQRRHDRVFEARRRKEDRS